MSMSVCLSMSVLMHISETTSPNFTRVFVQHVPVSMAWSSSGGVIINYVLPVLWMTSVSPIMGRMSTCHSITD